MERIFIGKEAEVNSSGMAAQRKSPTGLWDRVGAHEEQAAGSRNVSINVSFS